MLQADSLPVEPQEKPKYTGVSSLSLLQQSFLTQESKGGLLHCRWILYQLSYQGSPIYLISSLPSLNESIHIKCLEQNLASTKYYVSVCCYQLLYEILCPHDVVKSLLYCKVFPSHPLSPKYRTNLMTPFSKLSLFLTCPISTLPVLVLCKRCFSFFNWRIITLQYCDGNVFLYMRVSWYTLRSGKTTCQCFCGPSSCHGTGHIEGRSAFF